MQLTGGNSAVASFVAPLVAAITVFTFKLDVSDGSLTSSDTVRITVQAEPENNIPVAMAGDDQTVVEGREVTLKGSGSDPDNDPLTFSWTQTTGPLVTLVNNEAAAAGFVAPDVEQQTSLEFELTVSDDRGGISTDDVLVTVVPQELPVLIFPQFVNGETPAPAGMAQGLTILNKTRIILRNNGDQIDTGRVQYRDAAGNLAQIPIAGQQADTINYVLDPWSTLEIRTDGTGELKSGVVEVISDLGELSKLEGTEVFQLFGAFVSVPSSPSRNANQAYVSVTSEENTGIALFNPDQLSDVVVDLILLDEGGTERARQEVTIRPLQQLVRFLDEPALFADFFAGTDGPFTGSLNIRAGDMRKTAVLGLLQQRLTGALIAVATSPNAVQPE